MRLGTYAYRFGGLGVSVTRYRDALLSLLPQGRAFLRDRGLPLYQLIEGVAKEFSRVGERIVDLQREEMPHESTELLPDWEETLGLPDPAIPVGTLATRRGMVAARLLDDTGHSMPDIETIAAAMGYGPPVVTRWPPFRVGVSRIGYRLYGRGWGHVVDLQFDSGANDAGLMAAIERVRRDHATFRFTFMLDGVPVVPVTVDGVVLTVDGEPVTVNA